jgi:hypothetical protein
MFSLPYRVTKEVRGSTFATGKASVIPEMGRPAIVEGHNIFAGKVRSIVVTSSNSQG